MKKTMPMLVAATALGIAVWLFMSVYQSINVKQTAAQRVKHLPSVRIMGLDSVAFGTTQWANEQPTVVFYFDPTCEHCQNEATELKKQAEAFANVRLLWLSVQPLGALRQFEQQYALQKALPTLKIAQVAQSDVEKQFGFSVVPTILIYDAKDYLTKKYVGETKVAAILKHLK